MALGRALLKLPANFQDDLDEGVDQEDCATIRKRSQATQEAKERAIAWHAHADTFVVTTTLVVGIR